MVQGSGHGLKSYLLFFVVFGDGCVISTKHLIVHTLSLDSSCYSELDSALGIITMGSMAGDLKQYVVCGFVLCVSVSRYTNNEKRY